jgi:hypothetical protein
MEGNMPRKMVSRLTLLAAAALIAATPASVSDPIGVFGLIDRVVLEPDANNPTAIQVWGVFALADKNDRNFYLPPQRGYLYYSLPAQNPRAAVAEWADLKSVAGTGQTLGWGSRFAERGRIRPATEKPTSPDAYTLGFGIVKVMTGGARAGIAADLAAFAKKEK